MMEDELWVPEETIRVCEELASRSQQLGKLYRVHLANNDYRPLPHLFLGEVTTWVVQNYIENPEGATWAEIVSYLEREYSVAASDRSRGENEYIANLIEMSFLEDLPISPDEEGFDIVRHLGPSLKVEWERNARD